MTTANLATKPTYRKTVLVEGQQIPAHLLWTNEGHHGRPNSLHCYRLIDGRYRNETDEGTEVTSTRPDFDGGTYLPTRIIAVAVPARHKSIDALWHAHLANVNEATRDMLIALANSEDARWLKIASKIKIIHEDRVGGIENNHGNGMKLRLEVSL